MSYKLLNILVITLLPFCSSTVIEQLTIEEKAQLLFEETNKRRKEHQLPPLVFDTNISLIAGDHCNYMKVNNVINHDHFKKRFKLLKDIMILQSAGENCHKFWKFRPKLLIDDFMRSPAHRANVLGDFTHIGIAVVEREDGTDFITQIFVKKVILKSDTPYRDLYKS